MASSPETQNDDANDYSRFDNVDDSDDEEIVDSGVSASDRLQQMGSAKVAGNEHIAAKKFELAASQYRKGLKIVDDFGKSKPAPNPSEHLEAKELELSLNLNLSMAELKLEKWSGAKKAANQALKIDPKNIKALFRRGQAMSKTGSLEEAKNDYLLILSIDPNHNQTKKEYSIIRKKIIENKETNKKGFGGIFERNSGMYDDREQELALSRKRKAEEDAKLYKIYENEMNEKEIEFNNKQKKNNNNNDDDDKNDEDNEETFERKPYDDWKKDRIKKEEDEKKEKEREREAKREIERLKKKQEMKDKNQKSKKEEEDDDDDLDEEDIKLMESIKKKGYCHFRRDQSEEEKAIIGNITPQKITQETSNSTSNAPEPKDSSTPKATSAFAPERVNTIVDEKDLLKQSGGGSVWNANGSTWEETDCSEWVKENMKKYLLLGKASSGNEDITDTPEHVSKMLDTMNLKNTIPQDEKGQFEKLEELCGTFARVTCQIKKIKKIDGDASIAIVRGKKRYLFDLSAELEYEVLVDESFGMDLSSESTDKARQSIYKGKLILSDMTHDGDGLEFQIQPKTKIQKTTHQTRVKVSVF